MMTFALPAALTVARTGFSRVDSMIIAPFTVSRLPGLFARRPTRGLGAELLLVLARQPLPTFELHDRRTDQTSDRILRQQPSEDVEADVPAGRAPDDEAVVDGVPEPEARTAPVERLELPAEVAAPGVLQEARRLGALDDDLGDLRGRRPDRRELRRSGGAEVPIGVEGRPFGQLRRIGQRLPHHRRRMAEVADHEQRPLVAVLAHLGSGRRAGLITFTVAHRFFPFLTVF